MDTGRSADTISRFCRAAAANDLSVMAETLAPAAELLSPLSGRMVFRGRGDLVLLLDAVFSTLSDLRWRLVSDGQSHVVLAEAAIGPVRLTDAMVIDLDADDRIQRITPHVRPWSALTVLGMVLGLKMLRHPGAVRRALRKPEPGPGAGHGA